MHHAAWGLAAALLLAGCGGLGVGIGFGGGGGAGVSVSAGLPGGAPARDAQALGTGLCEEFDRLERAHFAGPRPGQGLVAPTPVARQGERLLRAGCLARSANLAAAGAMAQPVV
ncbi:hypothetical protein BH23PSE1_BH23PSE1_06500 [soil metagenome]